MDVPSAQAALGLGSRPTWDEVRAAYRSLIREAHPDRRGGSTERAAALNGAYAALLQARRDGALADPAPPPDGDILPDDGATPAEVLDGDTVHLRLPPDEAFMRLLDAAHEIGHVTYLDRSCSIFEALVTVAGEGTCSLVVSLQGRADGTDAFCTLEAIEHVASPPVRHVVEALVAAL